MCPEEGTAGGTAPDGATVDGGPPGGSPPGGPGGGPGGERPLGRGLALTVRTAAAAGLGLAVVIFTGFILNLATGLTSASWAIAAGLLLAAAAAGAALRARRGGAGRLVPAGFPRLPALASAARRLVRAGIPWRSLPTAGLLLLAAGLASGAVVLAAGSAGWPKRAGFAQLWLVPAPGGAALGMRSDYPGTETFHVELSQDGGAEQSWTVVLTAGQSWQHSVSAPHGARLAARLATPDRTLTVEVTP